MNAWMQRWRPTANEWGRLRVYRVTVCDCSTERHTGGRVRPASWHSVPCCFSADSTNSSENIYTMMNPIGPGGNRPNVRKPSSSSCIYMYHVPCIMYHASSMMHHIMCHVSCVMYHIMCHVSCIMCHVMYHVSCVMYHVSCVMYHVSCNVSCVMYHVSCVMCHVSCVMCYVSCVMRHVSCVMCHVSCVMCHVSCNASCIMCHVSCVMCHVSCNASCVMCHVSCVMYHVMHHASCVMCHVSCVMCHMSCIISCIKAHVSSIPEWAASLPVLTCVCSSLSVPDGTRSWRADGGDGLHGAAPYERITRWTPLSTP